MFTVTEHNYAPGLRQMTHAHAETTISMILRGSIRERVGKRVEMGRPFSIVVKPGDTEHADEFGGVAATTIQIAIDAAAAAELAVGEPSLGGWRWYHGSSAVRAFLDLVQVRRTAGTHSDVAAADVAAADVAVADVAVADVSVANAAADALGSLRVSGRARGTAPKWLLTAREEIDDSALPRVAEVAARSSVHPVYFARSFRSHFGCSVTEHLRWRRIQRAAAAISATTQTLSMIAADVGYSDHAHMCREFRRRTGVSPSEFRARAAVVP